MNVVGPWLKIAIPPYDPPVNPAASRPACHAPRRQPGDDFRDHEFEFDGDYCMHCHLTQMYVIEWRLPCVILRWPDGTPVREIDDA